MRGASIKTILLQARSIRFSKMEAAMPPIPASIAKKARTIRERMAELEESRYIKQLDAA